MGTVKFVLGLDKTIQVLYGEDLYGQNESGRAPTPSIRKRRRNVVCVMGIQVFDIPAGRVCAEK